MRILTHKNILLAELVGKFSPEAHVRFLVSVMNESDIIVKVMETMRPDEVSELPVQMHQYVKNWLLENPKERTKYAQDFLDLFHEYRPNVN